MEIAAHRCGEAFPAQPPLDTMLSQRDMQEDVRELARLIEESHPDPYIRVGGRVAFRRSVRDLLDSLPADGLTVREFLHRVRPLVASLRDGHTRMHNPTGRGAAKHTWVELDIASERLYVSGVYRGDQRPLLGAKVRSVEGVAWPELLRRTKAYEGSENIYGVIDVLSLAISNPDALADLLGNPRAPDVVHMELELPDGRTVSASFPTGTAPAGEAIRPASRVRLPDANAAAMGWGFLGDDRAAAIFRLDNTMRYREAFEGQRASGYLRDSEARLTDVAQRVLGHPPPAGVDERIALVPSATEMLKQMFTAMRDAKTSLLVVDLRRNPGGLSLFNTIFGYFIYTTDELVETDDGYQIPLYSKLYFDNYCSETVERLRAERRAPDLRMGELDFSEERAWRKIEAQGLTPEERARREKDLSASAAESPTFEREFRAHTSSAMWKGNIVVLTAPRTYSAAFELTALLYKHGATVVGVPSAQAGNCFIDTANFQLPHSGLRGSISYRESLLFPDDPAAGEMLRPRVELTYDTLRALDFDPNASVVLALRSFAPAAASTPAR